MLAVAGSPYDTLEEVIGLRGQGQGSLLEFGISYRELPLTREGSVDWQAFELYYFSKDSPGFYPALLRLFLAVEFVYF